MLKHSTQFKPAWCLTPLISDPLKGSSFTSSSGLYTTNNSVSNPANYTATQQVLYMCLRRCVHVSLLISFWYSLARANKKSHFQWRFMSEQTNHATCFLCVVKSKSFSSLCCLKQKFSVFVIVFGTRSSFTVTLPHNFPHSVLRQEMKSNYTVILGEKQTIRLYE